MNREQKKTLAFVAVACVLVASAYGTTRPRTYTPEDFREQGAPFFPEFTDPRAAAALEVIDYDPATASALPFKVEFDKEKGWVIPSHNDYPADGKDRLAKTAAGVIDLKKDVIAADRADQHEELGVIDPLDTKTTSLQGRGKRVTIKDKDGKVLADFIIGKPVPGRSGQRYVRVPGQKRTYAVNVDVDLSARFADWIETNLLKLDAGRVLRVQIDNHTVDREAGTINRGDFVKLERPTTTSPWAMPEIPPGQEIDTAKVSALTGALADLKIVGIRAKPPGLTRELKATSGEGGLRLSPQSLRALDRAGFYMTRDGQLVSNQGDTFAASDEGLQYLLRFGEVTLAQGEALTAGTDEESEAKDEGKEAETKDQGKAATENRYLFVMVEFDPQLVPKPEALNKPADAPPAELPEEVFARTEAERKADEDKEKREREDYEKKLADGKKKAEQLTDRFAPWYYVVPGDAYRKIVVDRASLLKPKGTPTAPNGANPIPGLNFPGLNPGPAPGSPGSEVPTSPAPIP